MDSNLSQLPREVLHQIVLYLAPTAVLAFEQVCRRFHELCGPLVWRQKCITYFRYWNYERKISHRLTAPIDKTSWKQVYLERHEIDRKVSCGIDSILASQVSRIKKVKSIVEKGYEAKDVLLRCLLVADGGEDVLARRWYSGAILSCLHRCIAIEQWLSFRNAQKEKASLEHALGAFDMFVIEDGDGDLEDISIMLDRIAHHFRSTNPEFDELTTRKKAISLAEYVRAQNLVGIKGDIDAHYHDLQNNFIGKALQDGQHPSLPLISVAIYCSIAQRLGVNAKPCGFPLHVLAIIWSSHGQTLDDDKSGMAIPPQPIYMDPFRSECEIPVETLKSQLVEMGVPRQEHIRLLDAASTEEIVARCARNIIASFRVFRGNAAVSGHAYPKSAFYAAVWALLLLPKSNEARVARLQQAQYLPVVLNQIENEFPLGQFNSGYYLITLLLKAQNICFRRFPTGLSYPSPFFNLHLTYLLLKRSTCTSPVSYLPPYHRFVRLRISYYSHLLEALHR